MPKMKDFTVKVDAAEVVHTSISKSKGGFNSARIVVKKGDNEYMSISYEWENDGVPSFAMDLMGFMQANDIAANKVVAGKEKDYEFYLAKEQVIAKKFVKKDEEEEMCPDCGKPMSECICEDKKKK